MRSWNETGPSWRVIGLICICAAAATRAGAAVPPAEKVQYNRDVRPILSDTCFKCHGFDKRSRKADLRLDVAEEATKARDGATPIVPGHPEKSEAYRRLVSNDPDEVMPPVKSHLTLTPAQVATFKSWIEQGAEYQPHWAFVPPREVPVPEVRTAGWARNPIDPFILDRLEREGMKPSPEADRRTLIRRATLDLTGLPPTPAEVDAFLADAAPDAYEKAVDRLLASPRYGERMALEWLDAARYADSNGYQADPIRTMWPWRDWVVKAMNDNMPFNRFVIEQIAGDLLPSATPSQQLASAFNRNHTFNGEGGRIAEETRAENVLDRVDTTATAFLGLTVGCAKCHDHKYDPITQKEYYQLYAYFNQSSETGNFDYVNGGNVRPVMMISGPDQDQKLAALKKSTADAEAKLAAALPSIDAAQAEWEKQTAAPAPWVAVTPASVSTAKGTVLRVLPDGSVLAEGESPSTDIYDVVLNAAPGVRSLRLDVLTHATLPHEGPGRSTDTGNFVLTQLEADAVSVADRKQTKKVAFSGATASFSQPGWPIAAVIDADAKTGWAVWTAPDKSNLSATFAFTEPIDLAGGAELHLRLHFESEPNKQHTLGHFRLAVSSGETPPSPEVVAARAAASDKRSEAQKKSVRDYYRASISTQFNPLSNAVAAARKETEELTKALPAVMVMDDAKPRETHVLLRGQYDKPGDAVQAGTPAVLNALPTDRPNNRLTLARWLVDPANPLTARVAVNRYWQTLLGVGIVKTSDDFGSQGELPSHPELLDWLATRFVASGWDVKAMHRLIVTSATYRQASKVTPEMMEKDPANRLLSRGPRFRLSSFVIRDAALAASGLLEGRIGGPPVKPYQPPGVWEEMSLGQIKYEPDHGEALYRRSIYTFWRRTVAPTTLFDVSPRTVCMVRPLRTNTPLQALTLLNDPTYVEAARVLSTALLKDTSTTAAQKLDGLFDRLLARPASAGERGVLLAALDRLRADFGSDNARAQKLLAVGEKPLEAGIDPVELAAWTALVNTVMNLDEAITRE